jgi:hypothetical protein
VVAKFSPTIHFELKGKVAILFSLKKLRSETCPKENKNFRGRKLKRLFFVFLAARWMSGSVVVCLVSLAFVVMIYCS